MIISASRRTDIPAFYFDWFTNRLKEGYVLVPNPRNAGRLGKVELSAQNVDCIVFWTKNPAPMLNRISELDAMGYSYYIQFTLTPYDKTAEAFLPPKNELLRVFAEMSEKVGRKRAVWRYDPVFIDDKYSIGRHIEQFGKMCEKLETYTERCVISFIDPYKNISSMFKAMTDLEMAAIAAGFSKIAAQHGISLYTCSEEIDLSDYGIGHSSCIDKNLIEQIIGCPIKAKIDANQRKECRCIESVDIGAYNTCTHGCAYCYATPSKKTTLRLAAEHDPNAPMLTGYPKGSEIITNRTVLSQKIGQIKLF